MSMGGGDRKGFTIVELLIVIVVIGVLAAISIVAYNGIQTRATNASIVAAAKSTITLINGYKATYGNYPSLGGLCMTRDNNCSNYMGTVVTASNSTWMTELAKIGTPLQSVPSVDTSRYGLYFDGYAPRTFNHDPIPGLLMYRLKGNAQNCGVQNVAVSDPSPLPGEANAYMSSTNPYTSTSATFTDCWVSV